MHCTGYGHQASLTAGTIFHGTRSPLRLWFQAMRWVTAQKNGASARRLQRILGLGSYENGLDVASQAAGGDGPARAALYARVSTREQTVANQERELRQWAERLGLEVVAVYSDTMSGARSDRASLAVSAQTAATSKPSRSAQPRSSRSLHRLRDLSPALARCPPAPDVLEVRRAEGGDASSRSEK